MDAMGHLATDCAAIALSVMTAHKYHNSHTKGGQVCIHQKSTLQLLSFQAHSFLSDQMAPFPNVPQKEAPLTKNRYVCIVCEQLAHTTNLHPNIQWGAGIHLNSSGHKNQLLRGFPTRQLLFVVFVQHDDMAIVAGISAHPKRFRRSQEIHIRSQDKVA